MTRLALPFALLLGLGLGAGLALGATATASEGALTFKCTAIPIPITNPGKIRKGMEKSQELPAGWEPVGGGVSADNNGISSPYVVACALGGA